MPPPPKRPGSRPGARPRRSAPSLEQRGRRRPASGRKLSTSRPKIRQPHATVWRLTGAGSKGILGKQALVRTKESARVENTAPPGDTPFRDPRASFRSDRPGQSPEIPGSARRRRDVGDGPHRDVPEQGPISAGHGAAAADQESGRPAGAGGGVRRGRVRTRVRGARGASGPGNPRNAPRRGGLQG